jgi:hypothetical protein
MPTANRRSALPGRLEFRSVATSIADPATAVEAEPPAAGLPPQPDPAPPAAAPVERGCAKCGAPMDAGQDWCLNCGAGAPASLGGSMPGWRSGATLLAVTAVLALGAAAAAFAALSNGGHAARMVTATVAQATPPASAPGGTATGPASTLGTPTTVKPALPRGTVKPPKIPLTAVTPKTTATTTTPASEEGTTSTSSTTPTTATGGSPPATETKPAALLLDTNAATTYNPYNYAAASFGDPSLAIDGDASTGWTAQVDPTVAPKMAEGLVVDLKSARKFAALALTTSTPGMTIQIYGANGHAVPGSITDHAWVKLSPNIVEHSKHLRLKLKQSKKAFRFVTLWISGAPAASVGTPQAPGRVSVNELELFPAS